jgi:hypothetical protein
MKVSLKEIPGLVQDRLGGQVAQPLDGGPLEIPIQDLRALPMIPFFCDVNVRWCVRLRAPPGAKLDKKKLRIKGTGLSEHAGDTVIAVDSMPLHAPTFVMNQLPTVISPIPGLAISFESADLGLTDPAFAAQGAKTPFTVGNQRYVGCVSDGHLRIEAAAPAVSTDALARAVEVARLAYAEAPLKLRDHAEAMATVRGTVNSISCLCSGTYLTKGLRVRGANLEERAPFDFDGERWRFALSLFRIRLADGPWDLGEVLAHDQLPRGWSNGGQIEDPDEIMAAVLRED